MDHIHTGPVMFTFAGVSAIVLINFLRLIAAWLVKQDATQGIGKALAGIVTFG